MTEPEPLCVPPITLRELFAAVALHARIGTQKVLLESLMAEEAYRCADAMLTAREARRRDDHPR
jgi:hypothetical protein